MSDLNKPWDDEIQSSFNLKKRLKNKDELDKWWSTSGPSSIQKAMQEMWSKCKRVEDNDIHRDSTESSEHS